MKKVIVQLETGKTVELMGFNISGSNTVSMAMQLVELNVNIPYYSFDFSGYPAWKADNPTKTWRDYAKGVLLDIYSAYALAKQVRDLLEAEAAE